MVSLLIAFPQSIRRSALRTSLCALTAACLFVAVAGANAAAGDSSTAQSACVANFEKTGSVFKGFTYSSFSDVRGIAPDKALDALARQIALDHLHVTENRDQGTLASVYSLNGRQGAPLNAVVTSQGATVHAKIDIVFSPIDAPLDPSVVRGSICSYLAVLSSPGTVGVPSATATAPAAPDAAPSDNRHASEATTLDAILARLQANPIAAQQFFGSRTVSVQANISNIWSGVDGARLSLRSASGRAEGLCMLAKGQEERLVALRRGDGVVLSGYVYTGPTNAPGIVDIARCIVISSGAAFLPPGAAAPTTGRYDFAMTARSLATAFQAGNLLAFHQKYDGKLIQVTGPVSNVSQVNNEVYVTLVGVPSSPDQHSFSDDVDCVIADKHEAKKAATLTRGEHVVVTGVFSPALPGIIDTQAYLRNCAIVQ